MTKRIFPVDDWAPAQEAIYADSEVPPMCALPGQRESVSAAGEHKQRMSLSLPWRHRPKSLVSTDMDELASRLRELAVEPSRSSSSEASHNHSHAYGHGYSQSTSNATSKADPGSLRGIFRRASVSLKGMVHRRTSIAAGNAIFEEPSPANSRPGTSHSTWQRLRQATSLRHSRSLYSSDLKQTAEPMSDANLPIPGIGGPPIIPRNTGAAAKAAAALQNEYLGFTTGRATLHQQALHNKWLAPSASDDGNDRESGIGITVANSECELDIAEEEPALPEEDNCISRIDFISQLPMELAIQILSHLDAAGVATASRTSKDWYEIASNQHIWRDSFLREKTMTYATSAPTRPGAGLGVPTVRPTNDWKQIYRVRDELDKRWDAGKARPMYLNGHLDSIYCLQFDE